jgi:hypothetical protein
LNGVLGVLECQAGFRLSNGNYEATRNIGTMESLDRVYVASLAKCSFSIHSNSVFSVLMPIVRLWGGMGNQMFQYAFGRGIAGETGRLVKFDLENGFKNDPYRRRFALGAFNAEIVRAESHECPLGISWTSPWSRVAKVGWSAIPATLRQVVYEKTPFQFDSTILANLKADAYYFGYWQHEGYFATIQDELRREFTLRTPFSEPAVALQEAMARCRSVSVHVRQYHDIGADGKVIRKAREHHGACSVEYYLQAVERIGVQAGTVCFIFSDNLKWVKENLRLPAPCRYVADECVCSDAEELLLMASCQHHVVSNSSFSWWGAWLGGNPKKAVVAPRIWMHGLPENAVDICPKTWLKL